MAENWNPYSKNSWEPSTPITLNKMDKLEEGVQDNRDDAIALHLLVGNLLRDSATKDELIGLQNLIGLGSVNGSKAWTELIKVITVNPNTQEVTYGLKNKFDDMSGSISTVDRKIDDSITNILSILGKKLNNQGQPAPAYDTTNTVYNDIDNLKLAIGKDAGGNLLFSYSPDPDANNTIYKRITDIIDHLDRIDGTNGAITNTYSGTSYISLAARLNGMDNAIKAIGGPGGSVENLTNRVKALDGESTITRSVPDIIQELHEAHLIINGEEGTLDGRFDSIDTRINAIDGGSTPSRSLPNIITEINNAHTATATTLNDRFNGIDALTSEITGAHRLDLGNDPNTGEPIVDNLDKRFDDAEKRLEDTENILEGVLVSSVVRTPGENDGDPDTDTTYTTVDARLEAIEAHAAAARNDVNTIANELGMMTQAGAIEDTNTKVDRLNDNVLALGKEIGMLSDETTLLPLATEIDRSSTRIDTIDEDLNAENTGIKARLDAIDTAETGSIAVLSGRVQTLEDTVNDTTTGLAATKAIADANTEAIGVLENNKSATVIIPISQITYDSYGKPTIYTDSSKEHIISPVENTDYLLALTIGVETKYYYWKYIGEYPNGSWEQISGGGGSGNGNNNAEVFSTTQAFTTAEKEENKDYYVLDNNVWHHYRYIYNSVNERYDLIEIGQKIETNYIKRYNITKTENDNKTYLNLYEFPYGENKDSEDIDPVTDFNNLITSIELPQGGGGGFDDTEFRLYGRVVGELTIRKSIAEVEANDGKVLLLFAYTCYARTGDGEGESAYGYKRASYVLTDENGTVISSSNGRSIDYLTRTLYNNGDISPDLIFDVSPYYEINETNAFTLTLTADVGNNEIKTKTVDAYVNIIELKLLSDFSDSSTFSTANSIEIPFTFEGITNVEYTLHVLLDNNPVLFTINRGRIIIPPSQLTKGVHNLHIYATQTMNNESLESTSLDYQLALRGTDGIDSIMLFSGMSQVISNIELYNILNIPYSLYIPSSEESTLNILITTQQVDSTYTTNIGKPLVRSENCSAGKLTYPFRINKMSAADEYYLITISCTNANTLTFKIHVKQAETLIEIRDNNLLFNFDPMNDNYTNNTELENRLWSLSNNGITYKMRVPDGAHFDWRTGGWITTKDENDNDIPCFCVKAGSRVEFVKELQGNTTPLTLFWHGMEDAGSNFKCVFKIDNVKSPTALFLTSFDNTEHMITQYGKLIEEKYLDTDDKKSLISSYLNVKTNYIYYYNIDKLDDGVDPLTDDGENSHDDGLGTTILSSESAATAEAVRIADETAARKKNQKKIKEYIHNIYTTISQIDSTAGYNNRTYQEYLLNLLLGDVQVDPNNEDLDTVEKAIIQNLTTLDNNNKAAIATEVYKNLMGTATNESAEDIALMAAYREFDASGFNAITNGFIVEGKEKKDGIIAKLQFYIKAITKTFTPKGNTAELTISSTPIGTNPTAKTETYKVTIGTSETDTNIYEVIFTNVYDDSDNFLWKKIVGLRDATVTNTHHYGLELNASGSYMYLPSGTLSYAHSEGDIIEFEYNINGELDGHIDSSVIIYEDGVPSAADIYTRGKNIFEQYDNINEISTANNLIIGSDECDVYIFKMRLYDEALDNRDIIANFCADGLTSNAMIERHDRNKAIVAVTSKDQEITPELIANTCPDLRVIMIEAPNLTGGKNSFIPNTKIRCIYKNGRPEDNWVALNAYHAGQGTSSDNYGASGRNLDIMFGFDGIDPVIVSKPQKNNYSFNPNYISTLIKGINNNLEENKNTILDVETYRAQSNDYEITTDGTGTITLKEDSVPNNWYNIKLNIASSENVNNAYLQKRFDEYLPYETPARKRGRAMNPPLNIKNDMEFVNCVVFIKETGTPSEFTKPGEKNLWHFYGIGNIGDSKKTDKTRINVPGDPKEFAVELSDNGLKNSEFSTGIFFTPLDENEEYIEHELSLTPTKSYICGDLEYSRNNNTYTLIITNPNSSTLYLVKEELSKYTLYHRFMYINSLFVEVGRPITFENLEAGIKYPVSEAEWKCSLNTYLKQLNNSNRAKGWDKSFEFRYDLTTKDGETIERNELEKVMNDMHQEANKLKFVELYEWIVKSSNEDFKNHLKDWFIEKSPLYWYLFTERYTMIDSRAKNTFYHFGKIYISDDEFEGNTLRALNEMTTEQFLTEYNLEHSDKPIVDKGSVTASQIAEAELAFRRVTAQAIYDNRNTFERDDPSTNFYPSLINDGYRFELWDYDNDTALGINNNGQMVFEAGLEDTDKTASGWIYNAAESVFWCRIRDNMYDELSQLYRNRSKTDCFNDESLIDEFDELQAEFPEELWRLDFERKYFRPFKDSGETTYLNSMANGRKKYLRRQFERNMAIYISSKYITNASYIAQDQISFRPNRDIIPDNEAIITVKPYSTMYINFMIGNAANDIANDPEAKSEHIRIKAGQSYDIHARRFVDRFLNFQCVIYNACRIMSIEGIDKFACKQFIFSNAKKLSVLKLGGEYLNENNVEGIGDLGLNSDIPLLEELDISNIRFLTPPTELSLDKFSLLKKFNADGCNIQSFTFKDGGLLEEIKYFPGDMIKISFNNLYNLSTVEFKENASFTNLTEYTSYNSYSNSYNIVQRMINGAGVNKINRLILNDIDWTIGNLTELNDLITLKERLNNNMLLQGTIHVTGTWSTVEMDKCQETFGINNITFDISQGTEVVRYKIIYKYDDNTKNGQKIYELYITPVEGSTTLTIPEIYSSNASLSTISLPDKPETELYKYTFGTLNNVNAYRAYSGWRMKTINGNVQLNDTTKVVSLNTIDETTRTIIIETVFNSSPLSYPIYWYLNPTDANPVYISLNKSGNTVKVNYGESFNGHIPNVLDINNAGKQAYVLKYNGNYVGYKIFNGWQKAPINLINPIKISNELSVYKIYANWLKEGLNDSDIVDNTLTTLSLASRNNLDVGKLLLLSKNENYLNENYINTNDRLSVEMGYNGVPNGTILTPDGPEKFDEDRTVPLVAQCTPFNTINDAFTIAIDYQFDTNHISYSNTTRELVLAGCYENKSDALYGFRLYYDIPDSTSGNAQNSVRVGFGDPISNSAGQSKIILNNYTAQYRNIIVLRHPKNSTNLYIYSGIRYNEEQEIFDNIDEDGYEQILTWNNITTDAKLVFGGISSTSIRLIENAYGTIYWAKYWNEDLGAGECRMLANWPHEKMEYAIEDHKGMGEERILSTINEYTLPNISMTPLTISSYVGPIHKPLTNQTNGELTGWHNSWYRTYSNQRYFFGLPITLQAIITKTPLISKQLIYNGMYSINENDAITQDYIFLPSRRETTDVQGDYDTYKSEAAKRFVWNQNINVTVYAYDESNRQFKTTADTSQYRFLLMNIRFPLKPLGTEIRVFSNYTDINPVYSKINGENFELQSGDIFIKSPDDVAYIYVSSDEILAGAKIMPNTGVFECTSGGWIRAENWYTRSVFNNIVQVRHGAFIYVNTTGVANTSSTIPKALGNYNNSSNEQLASNATGACVSGSFGI